MVDYLFPVRREASGKAAGVMGNYLCRKSRLAIQEEERIFLVDAGESLYSGRTDSMLG